LMNLKAKKFFILRKTCHFFFLLLLPYTEPWIFFFFYSKDLLKHNDVGWIGKRKKKGKVIFFFKQEKSIRNVY
jgi:hypothetical protein